MTKEQKITIDSYNNSAKDYADKIAGMSNYNEGYEYFTNCIKENGSVLDLACGTAQISAYIRKRKECKITGVDLSLAMLEIAKDVISDGTFINHSIIDFKGDEKFDACILGFGIPYLSTKEVEETISNIASNLNEGGYFYISFMNTKDSSIEQVNMEKTSFGGDNLFEIHYHNKDTVKSYIEAAGFTIVKEYSLDYDEADGSVTEDVVLISRYYE